MKKGLKIFLIIASVLVVIYILLPYIAEYFLNRTIKNMETYRGHVESVDISLLKGGYAINGLHLERTGTNQVITYLEIDRIEIGISYAPLLKGRIVGIVDIKDPVVHVTPIKVKRPVDLVELVKDIIPIMINEFYIQNGRINLVDYKADPKVNVYLHRLDLKATNMSNIELEDSLPSSVSLDAISTGGGSLSIDAEADFLRQVPNLDMGLTFENINVSALNELVEAYAGFTFDTGSLSIFSEVAIKNGIINGYIKPVIDNVSILGENPTEDKSFFQLLWEGAIALTAEVLESPGQGNYLATRIPIHGNLKSPDTSIWPILVNTLENGFIEAFEKDLSGKIDYDEVRRQGQLQ